MKVTGSNLTGAPNSEKINEQGLVSHRDIHMSRSPEGYGSGALGLIHLAAKGVEKTTNDLSLSLLVPYVERRSPRKVLDCYD